MLLNYTSNQNIYVIGTGPYAQELKCWLQHDIVTMVELVHHDDFCSVPIGSQILLGFQNLEYRKNFLSNVVVSQYSWPTFIHSSAVVACMSALLQGTVINPQAVIGYGATLGEFCNIGILSKVGHRATIGTNTVISPGTMIGGSTTIGHDVFFGQSCSIKDKITICNNAYFAMSSVVSKDVSESGRYFGNRKIN